MAVRNISTRIAVQGESDYRAAITRVNAELKNMQSALKLTESQFKSNASSTEALTAKGKALNNLLATQKAKVQELENGLKNAQNAEAKYAQQKEELSRKIQQNTAALEKLKNSTGDTAQEQKRLEEENAKLNEEFAKNEEYLQSAHRAVNSWEASLNKAKTEVNNTQAAIDENSAALEKNGEAANKDASAIDSLASALIASGLKRSLEVVTEALKACVDASVTFESGMAGVKRTVGGSDQYLHALGESFKEMSTTMPITTEELTKIAETAGQLGIKQKDVEQFTTVMAKLATTTDLTAENAATMLAQFANITGITDYERLGSVVAELGDATATTASKVVDMSQGMAAAANLAGMSEKDILAIAAAVGSLGIEAQAGSTAMSTLISTLYKATETGGEKLEAFATVANMSGEEFKRAWQDDAVSALNAFIKGLNDTERNGQSAIMMLNDLGITNVRQTKAILGLASSGDLLTNTISQANKAWDENTALGNKAAIMYGTTEAKITMYKNAVDNLKIAVGDQLTPALGELAETGTDTVQWATEFVQQNEWLGPVIASVSTALATFTVVVGGTALAIKALTAIQTLFNAALFACPAFWIVAALGAVTAAAVALAKTLPSATKEADNLNRAIGESQESFSNAQQAYEETSQSIAGTSALIDRYIDRLDELNAKNELTASEQGEYNAVVAQLKDLLPDVNFQMDETGNRLETTTAELREGAKAWEEYARQQAFATIMQDQITELNQLGVQIEQSRMKMAEYNASATDGTKEYANAYRDLLKAQSDYNDVASEYGFDNTIPEVAEALEVYTEAKRKAKDASKGLSAEEKATAKEMGALAKAIDDGEKEFDAQRAEIEKTQKAMEDYEKSVQDASEASLDFASDAEKAAYAQNEAANRIKGPLQELAQSYKDAYDSARSSLDGQIGFWDKMESKVTSTDTLQSAVDSQITYLQSYADNMDSLLSRNIEGIEEFAKNFTDGSTESAAALAGLASASDEEIQNIMNSLAQVETYKDQLASVFGELDSDLRGSLSTLKDEFAETVQEITGAGEDVDFSGFIEAVDAAFSDVGVQFQTVGTQAGEGLAAGIGDGTGEAEAQATAMGQAVVDAVRSALQCHSPSAIMQTVGQNVGEGLQLGLLESSDMVIESAKQLGQTLSDTMMEAGQESVSEFGQELAQAADVARQAMSDANQAVRTSAADGRSAGYSVGAAISQGAAEGVRAYAAQVAQEAAKMVKDAINAAKREANINSPSKKMMALGKGLDEGLIVGIQAMEDDVVRQMKDTMREITSVQVEAPEIPNYTDSILRMMGGPEQSGFSDAILEELKKIERKPVIGNVAFTQVIHADDTSYVGQQREAKRLATDFARRLNG